MTIWHEKKDEELCENCTHFIRHYRRDERTGRFLPVNAGHCTGGRVTAKEPRDSCRRYERKDK